MKRVAQARYMIPGVLRFGSVNIFSGPTHGGKSTLLAQLISKLSISPGDVFGYNAVRPPLILYLAMDHSWVLYQALFDRITLGELPFKYYARRDDPIKRVSKMFRQLLEADGAYGAMEYLTERAGVKDLVDALVIVDPIHVLTGRDISSHIGVGDAMTDIGQFCSHRGCTLIGTAHTAKPQADPMKRYIRAVDRAAGSTALVAYAETTMSLVTPEEIGDGTGNVTEWHWRPRLTDPRILYMVRSEKTGLFSVNGSEEQRCEQLLEDLDAATQAEKYLRYIPESGDPIKTADVCTLAIAEHGVSRRYVESMLTVLSTVEPVQIERVSRGIYRRVITKKES